MDRATAALWWLCSGCRPNVGLLKLNLCGCIRAWLGGLWKFSHRHDITPFPYQDGDRVRLIRGLFHHPDIPFERFADDAVCHCSSERQAQKLQTDLERRFAECGLTLHPNKTQIVYCKDNVRRGHYPNQKFDFLGYTFRPGLAMNRWGKTGLRTQMLWGERRGCGILRRCQNHHQKEAPHVAIF
ncbi:reverse transcriptase domain-containing protein [Neomesorhizobium albiziae]|uniref:reverse transcriptase domain-containing protein n=1 Tax=Neomesorhizobium albiziae TaxID=335020 RepID=UPI001FCF0359|nr:reverse transcriptase domain-containing protein [Mesorhizobium albiziae]